ncbi:6-phospho-3-hexuloisomerase [Paenibacillus crassostreae]|uniref:6-phospho 3-hexuloisomerase n=1 Tax=Paenibacillus crassostreae TaxID=1763538 RepID=A0A167FSC6_9BACL|nr:6-phospho-3-hexuloisomerase [Paenibacillus crassostreae]AOZ94111.1 6-phospho 3-hexuloisomerase [Paenibacillus crassostreae]OAB76853.1 6-phospho 3-hexuloisomerase [Paenibacillus crassostreae]
MQTKRYVVTVLDELNNSADQLVDQQLELLVEQIGEAKRIFVAGVGRSGLMMRAFAMRLMHLGKDVYVVGETVTRSLAKGDLLIIGSGSGETKSLIPMAEKAQSLEACVAVMTLSPVSTVSKLSNIIVTMPGASKDQLHHEAVTIQPMGSLFEQMLLLICDAVVLRLMEIQSLNGQAMYGNHANLE